MRSFSFLEHTSDLYIEGRGSDLREAVEAVAQGLFSSICVPPKVEGKVLIDEEGVDIKDTIVNLFTSVLAEMDANGFQGHHLEILSLTDKRAKAYLYYGRCKARLHVKAVTFHGMLVEDGRVRVLFDI